VNVAGSAKIRVLDYFCRELDDRSRFLGYVATLGFDDRPKLVPDLFDDIVEIGDLVLEAFPELFADVLFPSEQADDFLAGHLLDLRRDRDLERIRKRHEKEVADFTHRKHETFLTKLFRNPLKGCRQNPDASHIERGQPQRPTLGHEELEWRDPILILQEFIERFTGRFTGQAGDRIALLCSEPFGRGKLRNNL
jgi:hypothetical protein